MTNTQHAIRDDGKKRLTLPYIGRCLTEFGLDVERRDSSIALDLGCDAKLIIGIKNGVLSVAAALPSHNEDEDILYLILNITMSKTMMTKAFIKSEKKKDIIWFTVDTFCKTRKGFKPAFDRSFKILIKSVRTFMEIREYILNAVETETLRVMISDHQRQGQLS